MSEKIEKANAIFDEWNDATGYFEKNTSYYFEMQGVIEDIVKMASLTADAAPQWIPVSERLPELDCPVLALDGMRHIAWISSVIGDWTSYEVMRKPTHWMPLPKPPESEA